MRRGAAYLLVALASLLLQAEAVNAAEEMPLLMYAPGINPQAFLPISYRCPPRQGGIVEIVKMSAVGGRIKIRVTFEGETPTHASVQRAWPNKPFEGWHEFANPRKRPEAEAERSIWQATLQDADAIRMAICSGVPETRDKYDKILEHNRKHLRPPQFD